MALKEVILKYALQNAVKFNGKANPGAVIGKLLAEDPSLRTKTKEIAKEVNETIKKVNKLKPAEQEKQLKKLAPELLEKKKVEKKKVLPELKGAVKNKVIMRFAPSPSGPLHLGHAYPLSLNSEYCRKYNGKLLLRIEDTNPENIDPEAYEMIPENAKWLTKNNISKVIVQSDRLGIYYDYAEKLVQMEKAYVCTCDSDEFRELIFKKQGCHCRNLGKKNQLERYNKIFGEYKPGEAVLRIKTDINHKNPAMRDFPLMRINEHPHPRKGKEFRVWPLMNMSVFVDDVELGITHVLRAKDHMDNEKRQQFLYKYFNKKAPEAVFVGKINFSDLKLSSSETKKLIEEKKYSGWDDIRLSFIPALMQRGYQPDAFIKYAVDVGVTQNDKTVSKDEFFKSLNHFNKEVLDPMCNRYFFIQNPKKITIKDAPSQHLALKLHPDFSKRGKREFNTGTEFYITEEDYKKIKGLTRLMDCLNFTKKANKFIFDSLEYEKYKEKGNAIIHWLPAAEKNINVEIIMPDKKPLKGIAESSVKNLKKGDIIQFERFAFCKLNKKEKDKFIFWYGHR